MSSEVSRGGEKSSTPKRVNRESRNAPPESCAKRSRVNAETWTGERRAPSIDVSRNAKRDLDELREALQSDADRRLDKLRIAEARVSARGRVCEARACDRKKYGVSVLHLDT